MRKIIALVALAALLALPLCACGKPGETETTTAFDLAAIGDGPIAFDLTDLNDFLSPAQRAALETALRAELAARGYPPESIALQFEDPAEGSVKLPFTNSGGSLANLDTDKLAEYIAGQIAEKVGVAETQTGAASTTTTTTTAATTKPTTTTTAKPATTKPTTTTQKPTNTTKVPARQYTPPPILHLSPDQITSGNRDNTIDGPLLEDYDNPEPMKIEIVTEYGTVLAVKRPYAGTNEFVMDFYTKDSNGEYVLKKAGVKNLPAGDDGMSYITLVGSKRENGSPDNYYKDAWCFGFNGKQGRGTNPRYEYNGHGTGLSKDPYFETYVFAKDLF